MASPQTENGYTKIANEILEAIISSGLNGTELACIFHILRKTYGFNKLEDEISLSQFQKSLPFTRPSICKALRNLQLVNIIKLVKIGKSKICSNRYAFNKNYEGWQLVKKSKLVKIRIPTSKDLDSELVNKPLHTKEKIQNKIQKKEYGEFKNVKLLEDEYEKLIAKLGPSATTKLIGELDLGIGSKGYKYTSHYLTILNWDRRKKEKVVGEKEKNNLTIAELHSKFNKI